MSAARKHRPMTMQVEVSAELWQMAEEFERHIFKRSSERFIRKRIKIWMRGGGLSFARSALFYHKLPMPEKLKIRSAK